MSSVPLFAPGVTAGGGGGGLGVEGFNYGGSNQYMSYPSTSPIGGPTPLSPGIVPPQSGYQTPPQGGGYGTGQPGLPYISGQDQRIGGVNKIGGGVRTIPSLDPYLTQELSNYLGGQVGQGVSPFDLSALLPSTGQATTPGTLTAPLSPLMQQLQQFFMGQSPGVTGEASASGGTSGSPLNYVLPMWQSEMAAMQQPIQEQAANLKEQYGSMGLTDSSAAATGLSDFFGQTAAEQESMLGQLTMQALPQEQQMAGGLQAYDQSAISNLLQEFERTSPQNNPLLNMEYGLSTTFPPTYGPSGAGGGLQGLLSAIPGLAGGAAAGLKAAGAGAGGIGSILAGLAAV